MSGTANRNLSTSLRIFALALELSFAPPEEEESFAAREAKDLATSLREFAGMVDHSTARNTGPGSSRNRLDQVLIDMTAASPFLGDDEIDEWKERFPTMAKQIEKFANMFRVLLLIDGEDDACEPMPLFDMEDALIDGHETCSSLQAPPT